MGDLSLKESLADVRHDVMARHRPLEVAGMTGQPVSIPCSKEDADELYRRLNSHFYAWTGKDLRNYTVGKEPSHG